MSALAGQGQHAQNVVGMLLAVRFGALTPKSTARTSLGEPAAHVFGAQTGSAFGTDFIVHLAG